MVPRIPSLRAFAAVCLLAALPLVSWGQDVPLVPATPPLGEAAPVVVEAPAATSPFYANAEFAVLFNTAVHVNGTLYRVAGDTPTFLSPRVFLGYNLDWGGSVRLTYRNLTEVATRNDVSAFDYGGTSRKTTFTMNWFDLDYVSAECCPTDWWLLRWEAGGRFVFNYNWEKYQSAYRIDEYSASFYGGGPHLGLTSNVLLGDYGWSLFGRADGAVTFGGRTMEYRHQLLQGLEAMTFPAGSTFNRDTQGGCQYDVNVELGLMRRWKAGAYDLGLGFGVQAEVITFGSLERGASGTFGIVNVGPFGRCEIAF